MPVQMMQKRHLAIKGAWLDYEVNPVLLMEMPLMTDASCPQTKDFYRAMRKADQWAEVVEQDSIYQDEYEKAVDDLEDAFTLAESHAKKMSLTAFGSTERRKIKKAVPFVQVAQNDSASPNERVSAWRKATEILEGIISLPDKTVIGLIERA